MGSSSSKRPPGPIRLMEKVWGGIDHNQVKVWYKLTKGKFPFRGVKESVRRGKQHVGRTVVMKERRGRILSFYLKNYKSKSDQFDAAVSLFLYSDTWTSSHSSPRSRRRIRGASSCPSTICQPSAPHKEKQQGAVELYEGDSTSSVHESKSSGSPAVV